MTAPTFDAAAAAVLDANIGASLTFALTVGSGSNRFLIVAASYRTTAADLSVSSVTYNGAALSLVPGSGAVNTASGRMEMELWYMVAPASGTANVVITWSGTADRQSFGGAVSMSDADQASPLGTVNTGIGTNTAPTLVISGTTDQLIFAAVRGFTSAGFVSGDTERFINTAVGNSEGIAGATQTGASSVTMDWTGQLASFGYVMSGIGINGTGGASVAPWSRRVNQILGQGISVS